MGDRFAELTLRALVFAFAVHAIPAMSSGIFCDRFEFGVCPIAPFITSPDGHVCEVAEHCSFTFTATGAPAPEFFLSTPPAGLTFDASTSTLSGVPEPGAGGVHQLALTVSNGVEPDAVQSFELTIIEGVQLAFAQQPSSTQADSVIDPPVTVRVEDKFGNLVSSATHAISLTLEQNDPAASLGGSTTINATGGVATCADLTLDLPGEFTLQASADNLAGTISEPFTVEPVLTISIENAAMSTFSSADITITLSEAAEAGGRTVLLSSGSPETVSIPDQAFIAEGEIETTATITSMDVDGTVLITATSPDYENGAGLVTVSLRTLAIGIDELIAIGQSIDGQLVLDGPAPPGGVTVALASSDSDIVSIAPAAVAIAEGELTGEFTATGESGDSVVISASSPGYATASTNTGGTNDIVSIGSIPALVPGEMRGLPISLSEPAPEGGLTIVLGSDDTEIAIIDATVEIAAGSKLPNSNPRITAIQEGTTVIRAAAEGFAADSRTVTVERLSMSISPDPIQTFESWSRSASVLLSRGAPAEGLEIVLTALDPTIFTVPASVFIPEGQTSVSLQVQGLAVGDSTLLAQADGADDASAPVSISGTPNLSMGNVTVGQDLQTSHSVRLLATPPEPVNITVTIASDSAALLSTDRNAVGSDSITLFDVDNTNFRTFFVQGLAAGATTTMTATAAGFNDNLSQVAVTPSGFQIRSPSSIATTTFSNPTTVRISAYRLNTDDTLSSRQELRAGLSVDIPVTSTDTGVGEITLSPVTLTGGGGDSANTAFNPLTAGSTTIAIDHPGDFTTPANGRLSIEAAVTEGQDQAAPQ